MAKQGLEPRADANTLLTITLCRYIFITTVIILYMISYTVLQLDFVLPIKITRTFFYAVLHSYIFTGCLVLYL